MNSVDVSVIVPVYNVSLYLKKCIDSIIGQSLSNIEIIFVNDASEDDSLLVLEEYADLDGRIKIINNVENKGLSESRNIGLREANGKYIWFVDSDDAILNKDSIMRLYQIMEQESLDILMFEAEQRFETDELENRFGETLVTRKFDYPGIYNGKAIFAQMISNEDLIPCAWMMMYRREYLYINNLTFRNVIHEDVLFTPYALFKATRVKCIREKNYVYLRRNGSLSVEEDCSRELASYVYIYKHLNSIFDYNNPLQYTKALQAYLSNLERIIIRNYFLCLGNGSSMQFIEKDNEEVLNGLINRIPIIYGNWNMVTIDSVPKRHLFPFEYVEKGSNILIYGLGRMGVDYLKQVEAIAYCNICAVSDVNDDKAGVFRYPFVSADKITEFKSINYYVIAIDDEYVANKLYESWIIKGIDGEKIISVFLRHNDFPMPKNIFHKIKDSIVENKKDNKLHVAIRIKGGIGDDIVSLALCRRINELTTFLTMDVYVDNEGMESVFGGEEYIKNVIKSDVIVKQKYDLVLMVRQRIHVIYVDRVRICNFSNELWHKVEKTRHERALEASGDENTSMDLSILKRAKMMNRDRYSMLGDGDVWGLSEKMSRLSLNARYEERFRNKGLGRYITINVSAGNKNVTGEKRQTKVWPCSKYEELCKLIKKIFPDIEIVQIGDNNTEVITNADYFVKGESLEVVKYILFHSLLHVDCEGGMVHMATQLETKCIVLFGPTPMSYYGYPQNINISAGNCNGCMGMSENWYTKCPLFEKPYCMDGISPEVVKIKVQEFLGGM